VVGTRELIEIPARHFHDNIVEGGLEVGRRRFGDLIIKLVEVVTDSQFSGDFSDGIARSFAGEC